MYAVYNNGKIVGKSRWPNDTSQDPVDEGSQEWIDFTLEQSRKDKVREIKEEGVKRVAQVVPAINSIQMVDLMAEIWPGLNAANLGGDIIQAKDIYVYAKAQIAFINSATQSEVDNYDPRTDPSWP